MVKSFMALGLRWVQQLGLVSALWLAKKAFKDAPAFQQPAENFEDVYYTVPLQVGGQMLHCVPDTGSFSVLLISKECSECGDVLSYLDQAFDPSKAPNYSHLSQYAEITFGSGSVHVEGGSTAVQMGNAVVVNGQKVWEIKQMDSGMQSIWDQGARFEGILGMGMATWVPDSRNESTLLANAHIFKFGMCLGDESDQTSKIYWGAWPHGPHYVTSPVVGKKHWAISVTSFGVGDVLKTCDPCAAVVDSGTSSLGAPETHLADLENLLKDSLGNSLDGDCSNQESMPDIKIGLKGTDGSTFTIAIPASWYVKKSSDGVCRLSLMTTPLPSSRDFGPVWLLGQPFIREYMVMYDRESDPPTMSFARRGGTPGQMEACPDLQNPTSTIKTFEASAVDHKNETLITRNTPLQGEDILIHRKKQEDHSDDVIFPQTSRQTTALIAESQRQQKRTGVAISVQARSKVRAAVGAVPFWTLRNFEDGIY
ncbi:unnamed protein product [Amoebophrya sp. A25]|nr:unnamed protein product [Amoebophrya sp. A25]|eukprot:GSA25T00026080001.1